MVRIRVDNAASECDGRAVWSVYAPVFDDQPDYQTWHDTVWKRHTPRAGFRLARAYDGDTLVGFVYGYTGQHGQWWTDEADKVLASDVATAWLGGHFEVVSLAVIESCRQVGTGRRLMQKLTDSVDHRRLMLMTTSDPAAPSRQLYASEGWDVIGPGIEDATIIMGKQAPPTPGV